MRKIVASEFALEILKNYKDSDDFVTKNILLYEALNENIIFEIFMPNKSKEKCNLFINEILKNNNNIENVFTYCYARKNYNLFKEILDCIYNSSDNKEVDVIVESSIKLSDEQLANIQKKLNKSIRVREINNKINQSLIAGFKILINDEEHDYSLLSKLK